MALFRVLAVLSNIPPVTKLVCPATFMSRFINSKTEEKCRCIVCEELEEKRKKKVVDEKKLKEHNVKNSYFNFYPRGRILTKSNSRPIFNDCKEKDFQKENALPCDHLLSALDKIYWRPEAKSLNNCQQTWIDIPMKKVRHKKSIIYEKVPEIPIKRRCPKKSPKTACQCEYLAPADPKLATFSSCRRSYKKQSQYSMSEDISNERLRQFCPKPAYSEHLMSKTPEIRHIECQSRNEGALGSAWRFLRLV